MLENTRFDPRETENDETFARELADGRDLFVSDAFGSAHRAHASTVGVAQILPAYAGLLLERELEELGKLLGEVERPFVLVSGGAKVEDKLGVLRNLGGKADEVLIGGKMAEEVRTENPLEFEVVLPRDVVAASAFDRTPRRRSSRTTSCSRVARPRHRPGDPGGLRRADPAGQDGVLERTDGRLRVAAVRGGDEGGGGGRREVDGFTVVGGADSVRALHELGLADRVRGLDRRRSGARVPGGQGVARRGSHPGGVVPMLIAGNWKMYKTATETGDCCRAPGCVGDLEGVDVAVCPPFTGLAPAVQALADTEIAVAAQNVHWEPEGAYTGEISAPMLVELGVYGAIVGHSERRQYFGETDDGRPRGRGGARGGLWVIACIGETEDERERGRPRTCFAAS